MTPATVSPKALYQSAHKRSAAWWVNAARGEDAQMTLSFATAEWMTTCLPDPAQQKAVRDFITVLMGIADPPPQSGGLPSKTLYPPTDTSDSGAPATVGQAGRKGRKR